MKSALTALLACLATAAALAAGPAPKGPAPVENPPPLRADHPLLGAWTFTSDDGCVETWRLDRSGHALVTSAAEVAEMHFTISDQPSAHGFYRWVDTLYKDNGKKDCTGQVTKAPRTTSNFILLNRAGNQFIFCAAENTQQCFRPFVKSDEGEI